ncbi:MAG TPA: hypothetical protein VIM02_03870 [Rhizomicrobium sp.]|jgi:hypothetical protein
MSACLAVIAAVCFHGLTSVAIHDAGLGVHASVKLNGAEATVQVRSDQVLSLDWRRLPGVCNEDFCVAYYRRCTRSDDMTKCAYRYAILDSGVEKVIELTASDMPHLKAAEQLISILSPAGEAAGEIMLAELKTEAPVEQPPYCRPSGPMADCWPNPPRASSGNPSP